MKVRSILFIILFICALGSPSFRQLEGEDETCEHGQVMDKGCECDLGYVGEMCNIKCPGFNEDGSPDSDVCNGNGRCELDPNDSTKAICICDNEIFKEPDCSPKCPGTRMSNDVLIFCNGHGTCEEDKCICSMGYYGTDCSGSCPGLVTIDSILKECNGNGKCNGETLKCECDSNEYDPITCGGKCESTETCHRHGLCNLSGTCDCIEGWAGNYCDVPCSRETCNNHGECVDGTCLCDANYIGDLCETKESSLTGVIIFLVVLNIITAYFWYKQAHKTVFERRLPAQFNPEQLAMRRQRELEQSQSLTRPSASTPPMPSAVATINKPSDHWACPACTFNNPGTASVCIVCNTAKGAVIEKAKPEDLIESDEEEVSIKKTRKSRTARKVLPKKEAVAGIPENLELLPLDSTEQETELFKNDVVRICMIMKRFENNKLFNILYRFYAVDHALSNVSFTTSVPKYITVNAYPVSSSTIEKDHPATQQLVLLLTEEKPIKIRISGSVHVNDETVSIQTGGLSIM